MPLFMFIRFDMDISIKLDEPDHLQCYSTSTNFQHLSTAGLSKYDNKANQVKKTKKQYNDNDNNSFNII